MIKITDPKFNYTSSFNTDLKKKFAKLERDRKEAAKQQSALDAANVAEAAAKVRRLGGK